MKRKVLIAEDEPEVLDYLSSYIPLLGYDVETAQDGLEALAKVNVFQPELLILDLAMPKLDGFGVLKEILKHHSNIKVLVVTGTRTSEKEVLDLGAVGVLYKPIDLTVFSDRIKEVLPPQKTEKGSEDLKATALIVEDEDEITEYIKTDILEPLGFEVFVADRASKGLELYKQNMPPIVVLDLACPNKEDGYELVKQLLHTPGLDAPKSLIIETAALGETVEELRREGLPIYSKPVDWEQLKERVIEACKKHNLKIKID